MTNCKIIICYEKYESVYEDNDKTSYEWTQYNGTLEQFQKQFPELKVRMAFVPEDNLLR